MASLGGHKGLLRTGGRTLIERTIEALRRLGCGEVIVVIRKDDHALKRYLKKLRYPPNIIVIRRNSRNPYYSTIALGRRIKEGGVLVFNVDAYFHFADLKSFARDCVKGPDGIEGRDMILWGMAWDPAFEDPAFIHTDPKGRVTDYGKNIAPSPMIFGQIRYCSARILRPLGGRRERITRMKEYMRLLIRKKYDISVFKTRYRVFDLDTPGDYKTIRKLGGYGL